MLWFENMRVSKRVKKALEDEVTAAQVEVSLAKYRKYLRIQEKKAQRAQAGLETTPPETPEHNCSSSRENINRQQPIFLGNSTDIHRSLKYSWITCAESEVTFAMIITDS